VSLGGAPIASLSVEALRAELLVEPHSVDLFGRSLAEAVDVGDDRSASTRSAALEAAAVGVFGDDLDRPLLDHGLNLSGGQRQRIALARALLADRTVLVLRDPTTAVDAVTENAIAAGIRTLRHGSGPLTHSLQTVRGQDKECVSGSEGPDARRRRRSTVLITTSPPLLGACDRVVFLAADGAVVEARHTELLERADYAAAVLR
jgi:putative ABC transport system ATP-binding protein